MLAIVIEPATPRHGNMPGWGLAALADEDTDGRIRPARGSRVPVRNLRTTTVPVGAVVLIDDIMPRSIEPAIVEVFN